MFVQMPQLCGASGWNGFSL